MKNNIINICLGTVLLGLGLAVLLHSSLGLDPLGAFVNAWMCITKLSYGVMLTIINVVFLIIHFIKYKNIKYSIIGLLMSIVLGFVIDLAFLGIVLIPNGAIWQKTIIFVIGFLLLCLAIALIQKGKVQKMPFESFQLTIAESINKDINVVRVYVEIVLGVIAIIMLLIIKAIGVQLDFFSIINIGTIIIMLLTGPMVNVMYRKLLKGE